MIPLQDDDSSHVDNAGFLVSDIEDVRQNLTSTPDLPLTIGYDLSPFEFDQDNFFVKECEPDDDGIPSLSEIGDDKDSSDDRKKLEIESLLRGGGTLEKQLARIKKYNTRVLDSDSESESEVESACEDEVSFHHQNFECSEDDDEEILNDSGAYAGLFDGFDNESTCNEVSDIDELVPLAATIQFDEQFSCEFKNSTITSDAVVANDALHKEQNESEEIETVTLESSSSTRPNAFAASVPLIKPPPAEKMRMFLKSKGLTDTVEEKSVGFETNKTH
jgi:hypothetical protein